MTASLDERRQGRTTARNNSDAISIDAATAQLLVDLLEESARRIEEVAKETNQSFMLAPTITYQRGKARLIRDQLPSGQ